MTSKLIAHLTLAHTGLELEIKEERKLRFPNPFKLAHLKKLKLRVKDKLASLVRQHRAQRLNVAT
jgi:uncharacterized protein YdcH (DUF465 family)